MGVWESAAGCMRNYLILREKSRAFRADPQVQEALAASRVPELAQPTLGAGESLDELRADDSFDIEAAARRGMGVLPVVHGTPGWAALAISSWMLKVPKWVHATPRPTRNPASPMRLTMNALLAAVEALCRSM